MMKFYGSLPLSLAIVIGVLIATPCMCFERSHFQRSFYQKLFQGLLITNSFAIFGPLPLTPVIAATSHDTAKITSKVYLDISIARQPIERVTLGIYGYEAPTASKYFLALCQGEYEGDLSYDGSQVSRVVRGERIDIGKLARGQDKKQQAYMDSTGKVRLRNVNLAEAATHSDSNNLLHDIEGAVSVPKGGGSFEFTITPKANPKLDSDHVVIGRVLDGMETLPRIDSVPVSKEDALGTKSAFAAAGKGFDPRAKIISLQRPLKIIKISKCSVDKEASSVASFLKF